LLAKKELTRIAEIAFSGIVSWAADVLTKKKPMPAARPIAGSKYLRIRNPDISPSSNKGRRPLISMPARGSELRLFRFRSIRPIGGRSTLHSR